MSAPRTFLVTGGNRGLGLAIARGLAAADSAAEIWLTARDREAGEAACVQLREEGQANVQFAPLDVTDDESCAVLAERLTCDGRSVDVLVNNAGYASRGPALDAAIATRTLAVNYRGARRVGAALRPLMEAEARVINVSSGMGFLDPSYDVARREALLAPDLTLDRLDELADAFLRAVAVDRVEEEGWPASAYKVSKAALNALTRIWARDWTAPPTRVYSVCPGWVRTDMGGPNAPRDADEGADTVVWLATATVEDIGETTGFYRDREPISW